MVEVEIDGQKVEVPEGSMVMHACNKLGTYVPHFCYHPKLSIAANCRMCLVDIEKAPKPMPACATPVSQGMIVRTKSEKAVSAQKGVMEFLLINHPLDCPICDQGGECQLQDLAVGYGGSSSRYTEEKRVVFHKDVGPLISMEEMTRCIHCTRCVRFGQEVAGVMELGMANRGEHSEITTFVGMTVDSELSGNMIDLCPVGALTSKPFRYSARTWELSRRKSISPHDGTGANLVVQVKNNKVLRVVPLENEEVNECWIADRDRFSYEALNGDDRLTQPMIRRDGQWAAVDWQQALEHVAGRLRDIRAAHGPESLGALLSPHSTLEELHLAAKLMRGLGSDNIDFRLRHSDFSDDAQGMPAARWLGMPIAGLSSLQRALVVGSFLRKDHPLFSARLRQAARRGAQISRLGCAADDWLMPLHAEQTVAPDELVQALAEVAVAVAGQKGVTPPAGVAGVSAGDAARRIAQSLAGGERKAVLLGNLAAQHPQAGELLSLAQFIAEACGASYGYLTEAANTVGGYLAQALPTRGGLNARSMLRAPRKAYVLLNVEPRFDCADAVEAARALDAAEFVVALTPFKSAAGEHADVLLPVGPFTETSGTFVNAEGRVQSFHAVVRPLGETRPAWKVLRVLGNLLQLPGFEQDSTEDVKAEILHAVDIASRVNNSRKRPITLLSIRDELQRVADVPIYAADALVRRAPALQATADARPPVAALPAALWQRLGLQAPARVRIRSAAGAVELPAVLDAALPPRAVRVSTAHAHTAALGAMFGAVTVEKA
jgi:NADH-quinone oxidoreductase subunit G